MANIAEQENACIHAPSLKMRQRLQSAPEKLLKSPMIAKTTRTPLPSGRKAFGNVNKKISTPAVNVQEKKLLAQETKVKLTPHSKLEEYPEIEKFIPYDPLECDKYGIPEDLIPLGGLALPGLACLSQTSHRYQEDLEKIDPLPNLSPVKLPKRQDYCLELDAFLQTIDELTIELPPESF
ncbi:securin [Melanotaenia boesemani]|uniref:securin n=1 Tax=Melanotaenia boesemani TaxID=1250792 RepID=UPI001C05C614|nr:securin [Melanotaenia boesemani]